MRVVVERAFGRYSVGAIITDMPGNQARALIERGMVREYDADGKAVRAPADRMVRKATVRKAS